MFGSPNWTRTSDNPEANDTACLIAQVCVHKLALNPLSHRFISSKERQNKTATRCVTVFVLCSQDKIATFKRLYHSRPQDTSKTQGSDYKAFSGLSYLNICKHATILSDLSKLSKYIPNPKLRMHLHLFLMDYLDCDIFRQSLCLLFSFPHIHLVMQLVVPSSVLLVL